MTGLGVKSVSIVRLLAPPAGVLRDCLYKRKQTAEENLTSFNHIDMLF